MALFNFGWVGAGRVGVLGYVDTIVIMSARRR